MKNLENGTEFIWPKEKFLNRLYLMKEMYNNYEEEEEDWDLPEDKDPFQEDVNTEVSLASFISSGILTYTGEHWFRASLPSASGLHGRDEGTT